jgi:hypothetical protein
MALRVKTQISGDVFTFLCDSRIVFGDEGSVLRERIGSVLPGTPNRRESPRRRRESSGPLLPGSKEACDRHIGKVSYFTESRSRCSHRMENGCTRKRGGKFWDEFPCPPMQSRLPPPHEIRPVC